MKVTIMTKLYLTIFFTTLFVIFSSCLSDSENVATLKNSTKIGSPNSHSYEVDNFGVVGNQCKRAKNSTNVTVDVKNKPIGKKMYPFNIELKNTNSAYWPSGASVKVVFNGISKTFSNIQFLTEGINYLLETSTIDNNSIDVSVACYATGTTIYENHTLNVQDCPKYILNFYMKSATLECDVITSKNSVVCVRE